MNLNSVVVEGKIKELHRYDDTHLIIIIESERIYRHNGEEKKEINKFTVICTGNMAEYINRLKNIQGKGIIIVGRLEGLNDTCCIAAESLELKYTKE